MEENKVSYNVDQSSLDTDSIAQLIQNHTIIAKKKERKWHRLIPISIFILYAIVGSLILHLSISSSLREEHIKTLIESNIIKNKVLKSREPESSSYTDLSFKLQIADLSLDLKSMRREISLLKLRNQFIVESLISNFTKDGINGNKNAFDDEVLSFTEEIPNMIQEIQNVTEKLDLKLKDTQKKLENTNMSFQNKLESLETKIYKKVSKNFNFNISMELSRETALKYIQESSDKILKDKRFLSYQKILFDIFKLDDENSKILLNIMKNSVLKDLNSCNDYKKYGITKNGFYNINLSMKKSQMLISNVYCDFESDTTLIYHNGTEGSNVGACESDSCFEYNLNYTTNLQTIQTLIDRSEYCEQNITFQCLHAHLEKYGSWYDRFGEKQLYFTGSNYGQHICSCYNTTEGCSGLPLMNKCNCDASQLSIWMKDTGIINNKTALPITKFTYGYLHAGGKQKAFVQIGPLKCTGEKKYDPSKNCEASKSPGYKIFKNENRFTIQHCDESFKKTSEKPFALKNPFAVFTHSKLFYQGFQYLNDSLIVIETGWYNLLRSSTYYGGTRYTEPAYNHLLHEQFNAEEKFLSRGRKFDISNPRTSTTYRIYKVPFERIPLGEFDDSYFSALNEQ